MDPFSIGFIALLVVLSGAIAYVGDVLGRRLGKRRLTIGKLRPRHTAAVITAVAGMMATLVTVIILATLSEPVRVWIVQGRQAQEKLVVAERDLASARDELGAAQSLLGDVRSQLDEERRLLAIEQQRVADATSDAARLQAEASRLQSEIQSLQSNLTQVRQSLENLQTRYQSLLVQAESVERNNESLIAANQLLSSRNLILENEIATFERQISTLNDEVSELEAQVTEIEQARDEAFEAFQETNRRTLETLADSQRQLEDTERELSQARNLVQSLQITAESLRRDLGQPRTQPLVMNIDDELARSQIRDNLNFAEARTLLEGMIEASSARAKNLGAFQDPGPAVGFVRAEVEGRVVTSEEQFLSAVDLIANKPDPLLVIVRSRVNTFLGEFVPIYVEARRNPIVYSQGQLITEFAIQGGRSESLLADDLIDFIQNTLAPKAIADGMVPVKGSDQPLGEIPSDQLIATVQSLRGLNRQARVQFISSRETRAGDSLVVEIIVR